MAIQNRDNFLSNLSRNLGRKRPSVVQRPTWALSPQLDVFAGLSQDELVEKLIEQCENIHTKTTRTTKDALIATLQSLLHEWDIHSIIYANDKRFDELEITPFLSEQNRDSLRWNTNQKEKSITFGKQADLGITFSDMTLAESGTVVLFNEGIKGRPVSLLPESYIAIVPKSSIVPRLTQAVSFIHSLHKNGAALPSCVNFISGPSNSADIEMNLVVGVHGPVRAAYIIVDDL